MFKLVRFTNVLNGLKHSTVGSGIRSFADDPPRMEKTINSIQLLGRVGVQPQQRGTEKHPVITFTLATHNNFKTEDGDWIQKTDWHKVVIFKPTLREAANQYLTKGQRVLINGKLSYGEIKDRDGVLRPATTIIADDMVFFQ